MVRDGIECVWCSSTYLKATCDSKDPGFVIFLEQYALGWTATVDGIPAPVLRANLVMRAVPTTAGRHRIELRYWPDGLAAGLALSATAVAICLVLLVACRRRRRRESWPPSAT